MNKSLLTLGIAVATSLSGMAEVKVTVTPLGENRHVDLPMKAQSNATEYLIREDFSGLTAGSEEAPDFDNPLGLTTSPQFDPDLFGGMEWQGYRAYSAGGAVAMRTFDPASMACVSTPRMDYSGSVKVSFLMKYLPVSWEDEETGQTMYWPSSTVYLLLGNDRNKEMDVDGGEMLSETHIYRDWGWTKVEVEFDNYSAYNDSYLAFYCVDGVILDDIEVASSVDNFIAAPAMSGIKDITETSFTATWEPVHKAYTYWTYLYSYEGDDENGDPILRPCFDPDTKEMIANYGMTEDDYIEYYGADSPYLTYSSGITFNKPTECVFCDLDPEKEYYYAIVARYMFTNSEKKLVKADVIAAPRVHEAADITKDSFTAVWDPIAKADNYEVSLFGVDEVTEDTEGFVIFNEDFDKVSDFTDCEDIYDPEFITRDMGITLDDLTTVPGWDGTLLDMCLVKGMLGLDDWSFKLYSPTINVSGSDLVTLSLNIVSPNSTFDVYFNFCGVTYQMTGNNGVLEGSWEIPTNGESNAEFWIAADEAFIFIDYIQLSQDLKKGDFVTTFLGKKFTENKETSMSFSNLSKDAYTYYGYTVRSFKGNTYSEPSERMLVNLNTGGSHSGVEALDTPAEVVEIERYNLQGQRLNEPVKGVNVVRYSDGSVRKIMVK